MHLQEPVNHVDSWSIVIVEIDADSKNSIPEHILVRHGTNSVHTRRKVGENSEISKMAEISPFGSMRSSSADKLIKCLITYKM